MNTPTWRVILIGGPSHTGKSTAERAGWDVRHLAEQLHKAEEATPSDPRLNPDDVHGG